MYTTNWNMYLYYLSVCTYTTYYCSLKQENVAKRTLKKHKKYKIANHFWKRPQKGKRT